MRSGTSKSSLQAKLTRSRTNKKLRSRVLERVQADVRAAFDAEVPMQALETEACKLRAHFVLDGDEHTYAPVNAHRSSR